MQQTHRGPIPKVSPRNGLYKMRIEEIEILTFQNNDVTGDEETIGQTRGAFDLDAITGIWLDAKGRVRFEMAPSGCYTTTKYTFDEFLSLWRGGRSGKVDCAVEPTCVLCGGRMVQSGECTECEKCGFKVAQTFKKP